MAVRAIIMSCTCIRVWRSYSVDSLDQDRVLSPGHHRHHTLFPLVPPRQYLHLDTHARNSAVCESSTTLCHTKSPRTIFQSLMGSTGFLLCPLILATRLAAAVQGRQDISTHAKPPQRALGSKVKRGPRGQLNMHAQSQFATQMLVSNQLG